MPEACLIQRQSEIGATPFFRYANPLVCISGQDFQLHRPHSRFLHALHAVSLVLFLRRSGNQAQHSSVLTIKKRSQNLVSETCQLGLGATFG